MPCRPGCVMRIVSHKEHRRGVMYRPRRVALRVSVCPVALAQRWRRKSKAKPRPLSFLRCWEWHQERLHIPLSRLLLEYNHNRTSRMFLLNHQPQYQTLAGSQCSRVRGLLVIRGDRGYTRAGRVDMEEGIQAAITPRVQFQSSFRACRQMLITLVRERQ